MKRPLVFIAAWTVFTALAVFPFGWIDYHSEPPAPPEQSLSDRINSACPKGYEQTNWETHDEFNGIPPETVRVTCTSPTYRVVYRSVQR